MSDVAPGRGVSVTLTAEAEAAEAAGAGLDAAVVAAVAVCTAIAHRTAATASSVRLGLVAMIRAWSLGFAAMVRRLGYLPMSRPFQPVSAGFTLFRAHHRKAGRS